MKYDINVRLDNSLKVKNFMNAFNFLRVLYWEELVIFLAFFSSTSWCYGLKLYVHYPGRGSAELWISAKGVAVVLIALVEFHAYQSVFS